MVCLAKRTGTTGDSVLVIAGRDGFVVVELLAVRCGTSLVVGDVVLALVEIAAAVRVGEVAPGLWAGPGVRVRRGLHLAVLVVGVAYGPVATVHLGQLLAPNVHRVVVHLCPQARVQPADLLLRDVVGALVVLDAVVRFLVEAVGLGTDKVRGGGGRGGQERRCEEEGEAVHRACCARAGAPH